jgi:hypothetical protein
MYVGRILVSKGIFFVKGEFWTLVALAETE